MAGMPGEGNSAGARLWERVSSGTVWAERLTSPIHAQLPAALKLSAGQRVLDIGCGDGAYFPTVFAAVGLAGHVHGIDASPTMVHRARARITGYGWPNVTVELADATSAALEPEGFDAAMAVFAFSAMSDVPAAISRAHQALRPGGRLFVVDLRLVPRGVATPLIHLARWGYRRWAGWSGIDVLDTLRVTFAAVDVRRGDPPGWPPVAVATAHKPSATTHDDMPQM